MPPVESCPTMPGVAARRRDIDPEEIERLEELRANAQLWYDEALAAGPDPDDDVLGAIAHRSVFPEPKPYCPTYRDLINQARDERATWREIATAMGVPQREQQEQAKQDWRNRTKA